MKEIKVIELFAGVGGFRIGLEGWNGKSPISGYSEKIQSKFKVIWSNQWEPSTNKQEASDIYENIGAKKIMSIKILLLWKLNQFLNMIC